MKLNLDFKDLDTVRQNIGAPLISWSVGELALTEFSSIELELAEGKELDIRKVERKHTLFTIEDHQVVLYIKDHRGKSDVIHTPKAGKRLHLLHCSTLEHMARNNRFDRYVATTRRDGLFKVDVSDDWHEPVKEMELALRPCMNCLKELNYQNYKSVTRSYQKDIFENFDIEAFFEDFSTHFQIRPTYTDETAPINRYVPDWSRISMSIREQCDWKCSKCEVDLSASEHRKFLHTHHKDGQKGNNRLSNLEPLCVVCHADEPGHGHLRVSSRARIVIKKLRRQNAHT